PRSRPATRPAATWAGTRPARPARHRRGRLVLPPVDLVTAPRLPYECAVGAAIAAPTAHSSSCIRQITATSGVSRPFIHLNNAISLARNGTGGRIVIDRKYSFLS